MSGERVEIEVQVARNLKSNENRIEIIFDQKLDALNMPSKQARELAIELWEAAARADGVEPTPLPLPSRLAGSDPGRSE